MKATILPKKEKEKMKGNTQQSKWVDNSESMADGEHDEDEGT